jgi:hypothetical protein
MRPFDEPCAALGSVCSVARCRLVCSDTFQAMVDDGVMPSRHLLLHDCQKAMSIAKKTPMVFNWLRVLQLPLTSCSL